MSMLRHVIELWTMLQRSHFFDRFGHCYIVNHKEGVYKC